MLLQLWRSEALAHPWILPEHVNVHNISLTYFNRLLLFVRPIYFHYQHTIFAQVHKSFLSSQIVHARFFLFRLQFIVDSVLYDASDCKCFYISIYHVFHCTSFSFKFKAKYYISKCSATLELNWEDNFFTNLWFFQQTSQKRNRQIIIIL